MSVLLLIMLYYFLCKLCGFCNACWLFCIYFYVVVHCFASEFLFVQHFKSWDTDIFRNDLDLIKIQLIFHEKNRHVLYRVQNCLSRWRCLTSLSVIYKISEFFRSIFCQILSNITNFEFGYKLSGFADADLFNFPIIRIKGVSDTSYKNSQKQFQRNFENVSDCLQLKVLI